ncbi:MAG: YebC/PmpR family DNA-binding transcriptional regulator [Planctomycetes bacterium]|nr:YebC/PmpR family DNA-binding transcriptional regulator [Planctomycetota bacterium]
MSGHSHWAGIKHKKAANDAKRGKVWSKCARIIIVAARGGGGDPAVNLALRYAIEKAKSVNMPKDTIEKAIKKGTGDVEGVSYEEILYEGYGTNGVAIMVETLTDNRNRTGPEIKRLFERHGGSFGISGCVSWMFSKKGVVTVSTATVAEEDLMDIALGAGADDMQTTGEVFEITCEPTQYDQLLSALRDREISTEIADLVMVPQNTIDISEAAVATKILKFMEALDDHDDVQNVSANFNISDEIVAQIS